MKKKVNYDPRQSTLSNLKYLVNDGVNPRCSNLKFGFAPMPLNQILALIAKRKPRTPRFCIRALITRRS